MPENRIKSLINELKDKVKDDLKVLKLIDEIESSWIEQHSLVSDGEEKLQSILNNVYEGIITINSKGIIDSFNLAAENIFGYEKDEVIGKNVKILMPEPYHSEHDGYLLNYMNGGKAKVIGIGREVSGRRKNGTTFPLFLAVTNTNNKGQPLFVGMVRDLSEQKRLEKLKNEFVSTVSHELRTPLTSIRGSLSLIDGGAVGEVSDKIKPLIEIALNNSERLILLINDILDMEKIESGEMDFEFEKVDINEMIEEAILSNQGYAKEHNVNLTFENKIEKTFINVDINRLQQVLSNLISNAIKYSPKNETVLLSIEKNKRQVTISIYDKGVGIPDSFKKRIFQKFAQADSSNKKKGGTGLGLNISKAIIEKFNGEIGFFSPKNEGTTFYFNLPISSEINTSNNLLSEPRGKVLVVEDEHDIATLIKMILEKENLDCDIAYSIEEARNYLKNNIYDVMTLDVLFPEEDGITWLEEIRKNESLKDLAVIIISAKAISSSEGNKSVELSIIDWINKPINEDHLISSLNKVIQLNKDKKSKILHIEDDLDIAHLVNILTKDIADITLVTSNKDTLIELEKEVSYDLILLDMMLSDGSVDELIPRIKKFNPQTPIVLFSAKEVDFTIKKQVVKALVKSRTSNALLVETIKNIIK
jgi:PAS domain S-box-containing protein